MNVTHPNAKNTAAHPTLANVCLASCRKLLAHIENAKRVLLTEFRDLLETHEPLVRLALVEAETLAWQTAYPHLVFPALATEKVEAVAAGHARQRSAGRTALPQPATA